MTGTNIQWCDATCNPVVCCDGCELWNRGNRTCYAGVLENRDRGADKGLPRHFAVVTGYPGWVKAHARRKHLSGTNRPRKPWLDGYPRNIVRSRSQWLG